jgi:hypothetical protein
MKANFENLTPELKNAVISIAETIKPLIEDIHNGMTTGKDYYSDYMRILAYGTKKGNGFVKLMAIAMLYLGCNPNGIDAAVKNII